MRRTDDAASFLRIRDQFAAHDRKPRQKLPGIDLTGVKVESDGSNIKVTFAANSNFPVSMSSDQSAVWHVHACAPDGNQCCFFGAKSIGTDWKAYVFDMGPARNTYIDAPVIES